MAKGKKTGGKNFQPGVVTNPNGRPPVPEDLRVARTLNKIELEKILNKYIHMSKEDINKVVSSTETSIFEAAIANVLMKAAYEGDQKRLDFILDRLGIIVKKEVEASGEGFRFILEDYRSEK